MKECAKINKILSRYIDGEANNSDAALVRAHLDNCFSCRRELSGLSRVKETLLNKERKSLPVDYLMYFLRQKIANEQRLKEQRLSSWAVMGNLSRRFIPVPVTVIVLSLAFLFLTSKHQAVRYSLEDHLLSGAQTTTVMALGLMLGA